MASQEGCHNPSYIPSLSQRLFTIAQFVPRQSRLADIGSDHALLPTWLAMQKRITFAIAGELNDGPYEAAKKQVELTGVKDIVNVRQGDGLSIVRKNEVDVITIAGMGGALITSILDHGKDKLENVARLVLQPNVASDQVRRWLLDHHWLLQEEKIIKEDGRFYEILVAEPVENRDQALMPYKQPSALNNHEEMMLMQIKMGPWLLRNVNDVFFEKWEYEADKLRHICAQIERSTSASEAMQEKKRELENILEVITCLQMHKP